MAQSRQAAPAPAPREDASLRSIPVRDRTPAPPAKPAPAPVAAPEPDRRELAEALKGRVLVSPWTAVSPIQGAWAWANDPAFVIVFGADGTMRYGPSLQGVYQLLDAQTIRYQLMANGQPVPGQGPQDWRVGFFEGGAVLVLMREQQAMLFRRAQ